MAIKFFREKEEYRVNQKTIIKNWTTLIAKNFKKEIVDLNIIFTSSSHLKQINIEFLKHYYFTDVITFDYSEGKNIIGEIYIAYDTVKLNSKTFKISLRNEITRVIVHGLFHLIGFDDKTAKQKAIMRKLETNALKLLSDKYEFKF